MIFNNRKEMLSHIPNGGIAAEIGVLDGDFSQRILDLKEPDKLFLVDPWEFFNDAKHLRDSTNAPQNVQDQRYQRVFNRFREEIQNKQVFVYRKTSVEAAPFFKDHFFDWIYLDANHSYEDVSEELELFYPKIKPGGYILGDDYVDRSYYGVIRAVNEFCNNNNLELYSSLDDGNQYLIPIP